jgi:putative hydrolase of the HAD superfamily
MSGDPRAGLVLWDFDGTLAERPGMWRACLVETLDENEPAHGIASEALIPYLRDGFPWHRPDVPHPELCSPEAWWAHVGTLLARAYEGVGVQPSRAAELARLARDRYVDPTAGWRLFDDTVPALETLSRRGWRHVVLSNHVPELGEIVRGLGLAGHVDEILTSAMTGYEKPHPKAFEAALRHRRNGAPVWMVGDNPEADVAGARRAGLEAVLVRSNGKGLREAVDLIVES